MLAKKIFFNFFLFINLCIGSSQEIPADFLELINLPSDSPEYQQKLTIFLETQQLFPLSQCEFRTNLKQGILQKRANGAAMRTADISKLTILRNLLNLLEKEKQSKCLYNLAAITTHRILIGDSRILICNNSNTLNDNIHVLINELITKYHLDPQHCFKAPQYDEYLTIMNYHYPRFEQDSRAIFQEAELFVLYQCLFPSNDETYDQYVPLIDDLGLDPKILLLPGHAVSPRIKDHAYSHKNVNSAYIHGGHSRLKIFNFTTLGKFARRGFLDLDDPKILCKIAQTAPTLVPSLIQRFAQHNPLKLTNFVNTPDCMCEFPWILELPLHISLVHDDPVISYKSTGVLLACKANPQGQLRSLGNNMIAAQLLLAAHADVNELDVLGETPLDKTKDHNMQSLLKKHGGQTAGEILLGLLKSSFPKINLKHLNWNETSESDEIG